MKNVKRHIPIFQYALSLKGKELTNFFDGLGKDALKAICEITINILNGILPLSTEDKENLRPHKNQLVYLSRNKPHNFAEKRKIIVQKGGGIVTTLLKIAIPLILRLLKGPSK